MKVKKNLYFFCGYSSWLFTFSHRNCMGDKGLRIRVIEGRAATVVVML